MIAPTEYLPLRQKDEECDSFSPEREEPKASFFQNIGLCIEYLFFLVSLIATAWFLNSALQGNQFSRSTSTDGKPLAHTINGSYAGFTLPGFRQDIFLGIPYAKPPIEQLRFRHPQPLEESWDDIRNASEYGPQCPGYSKKNEKYMHSEDCLTINIVRPTGVDKGLLPVAVYIYGAGVQVGGSDNQGYNMSFIVSAASDAGLPFIGVSFTYRASVGGWIISHRIRGSGNANIAFHDQRMALRWVQENIASFGGNPHKVTLWGGSSGARDVGYHLAAHGGRNDGLFRAAIMQSGSAVEETGSRHFTAEEMYRDMVKQANCSTAEDSLDCLRHVPYADINRAFEHSSYGLAEIAQAFGGPSIDGDFLATYGSLSLKSLKVVKVPVISGIVSHEGANQIPSSVKNWADVRSYLTENAMYPISVVDHLMSLYPPVERGPDDELDPPIEGLSITSKAELTRIERLMGDLSNNAGAKLMCKSYSSIADCYAYRFDATVSSKYDSRLGVPHGAEIGPVFQNFAGLGWEVNPFERADDNLRQMSQLMGIMWAGFITNLDPNAGLQPGVERWPKYTESTRLTMVFNEAGSAAQEDNRRPEALEYINSLQESVFGR